MSISWSRTLTGYGNLNSSKMKIISTIEKQLPLSLFDAEWAALSDKLNKKKYVSFTESERIVPRLFAVVYIVILIAGIGNLTVSFGKVTLTSIACALILGIVTNILVSRAKEE